MKVGDRFAGLPDEQGRRVVEVLDISGDLIRVRVVESDRWPWTVGRVKYLWRSTLERRYTPEPDREEDR